MRLLTLLMMSFVLIGLSCKDDDPCDGIVCLNGGNCANGLCNCPEGYSGSDCSIEEAPAAVLIKSIEVIRFPATDNTGAGWDLTSGADLTFSVYTASGSTVYEHGYHYEDVTNSTVTWSDLNISLQDPKNIRYVISLYDYDALDLDDFMGGIEANFYQPGAGFPTKITLDANGPVAYEVSLDYVF